MINLFKIFISSASAQSPAPLSEPDSIVRCGPGFDDNPTCDVEDFFILVHTLIDWAIYLSAMAVTVAVTYAAFMYLISGGEMEKVSKAKGAVKAAVIGLIIVLVAWIFINTLLGIFGICQNWNIFEPGTICGESV